MLSVRLFSYSKRITKGEGGLVGVVVCYSYIRAEFSRSIPLRKVKFAFC